ncbi:glycosyltransferase family 2 protein [Basilea psittacipulmonis]|uniref:glycosyltransferase family 2 protein n=1 Tax=Basilea psittacipulmonis TaxID=1472345 RepID=UPI00069174E1|nr:glycosyltransferase family 2 protein [Basilea psittacipulmonis]
MNHHFAISVILPAYNEADSLEIFLPLLSQCLQNIAGPHEIIIVDDGSTDRTESVFQHFSQYVLPNDYHSKLIQFSRNFGKEAAISAGLEQAQGDMVLLMDPDGQHPLNLIPQMVDLIKAGADVVAGVQHTRHHESWLTRTSKRLFYRLVADAQHFEIPANAADFRMMRKKVVNVLNQLPEKKRFMKGLYAWAGFKTEYIAFQALDRIKGESKFNFSRLFELALVGITAFSSRPLRWVSHIGMIISLCSILYGIYIIIDTLSSRNHLPGWPTLAAGMMFLSGIQLISLGVIGEYIGNIYNEVKGRPLYVINKIIEPQNTDHPDNDSHNHYENADEC